MTAKLADAKIGGFIELTFAYVCKHMQMSVQRNVGRHVAMG